MASDILSNSPAESASSHQLIQGAGASPAALAKFDAQREQLWPEQRRDLDEYLHKQSPEDLAEYVRKLSLSTPDDRYVPDIDDLTQPGIPRGSVFEFTMDNSRVFPGTHRRIRIYVPAQYKAEKPACVFVELDDLFSVAPSAFDNLIFAHEVPPLIAIGLGPGVTDSAVASDRNDPRLNRSFEFDGLNGDLARFLLDEVFPEVERHKTTDGFPIRLSNDPNDRAVGGISTGGIGAFTLAWQRPDAFRRVFTGIGTFVGMRGGDRYAVLVRKTEPKPIRIFMQDGSNDELTELLGEMGDWWLGNQTMLSALSFAGYSVEHVWGQGTHSAKHAIAVFPQAMRWLWKDWPAPILSGRSRNTFLKEILELGHEWKIVPGAYRSVVALAASPDGAVSFLDPTSQQKWQISTDGTPRPAPLGKHLYSDMAFDADGHAYLADPEKRRILTYDEHGGLSTVGSGIRGSHLVVTYNKSVYVTEQPQGDMDSGKLWLVAPKGRKQLLDTALRHPTGIAISPDGKWLAVAEGRSHWGYSYQIEPDGSVQNREKFYWFYVPDDADDSGAQAWATDQEGRLYAATRMGIQVFDRNGRVRAILPVPGGEATGVAFGGPRFDTLYVSGSDHKLYRRMVHTAGAPAWGTPIVLRPGVAG